jgi:hypothetical protein
MMANVRAERLLKIPAEPSPDLRPPRGLGGGGALLRQPSGISPALQLKREWSPWPEFGSDPENPHELSKG